MSNVQYTLVKSRVFHIRKGNAWGGWKNLYRCFCGKEFFESEWKVKNGTRKSCGCLRKNGIAAAMKVRKEMLASYVLPKEKRCKRCDKVKQINEFWIMKNNRAHSYCTECCVEFNKAMRHRDIEEISDRYVKDFGRRVYKLARHHEYSKELIEALRAEIIARRAVKDYYNLDGKKFRSMKQFAEYISSQYRISVAAVEKRLQQGHAPEDCVVSRRELFKNTKCTPLKATNIQTGEVCFFRGMTETARGLRIGELMVRQCLESGNPTRLYNNSKTKFTFKIEKDEFTDKKRNAS